MSLLLGAIKKKRKKNRNANEAEKKTRSTQIHYYTQTGEKVDVILPLSKVSSLFYLAAAVCFCSIRPKGI